MTWTGERVIFKKIHISVKKYQKYTFRIKLLTSSEPAETFEVLLVGATGGAVLGPQRVARITISKSDSPSGVVRFINESLITVANPGSMLKLSFVVERAGGLLGNATVRGPMLEKKKHQLILMNLL